MRAGFLNQAVADTRVNPYQPIVEVNAFRLLPKPPPVVVDNTPPPIPPATIKLTGITSLNGPPKVLLEITDATTKKVERPSPMLAGEKQGTVEVVSIDADKGSVVIRNSGTESTLTFEKDGIKAAGAGGPPVAMLAPPTAFAVPTPFPASTLSTVATPRNNVVMAGGNSIMSNLGASPNVNVGGGLSSIPVRPTRGVETSGDNNNYNPNAPRQLTREEQMILIEINRANPNRVGPPLPPTPLTPPKLPTAETPASPPAIPALPVPPRFNGRLQ